MARGVNMNDRNCENCTHRKNGECTRWDCEYEPKMDDLIRILSEIRSKYNCFDPNEEPYYHALSEAIGLISAQPKNMCVNLDIQKITKHKSDFSDLDDSPSAQPEQSSEIQDILEYLDTVLYPIISTDHWNVYSELHDMISMLPSAQPEITVDGYADGFADGYKRAMMDFPSAGQWIPVTERLPEEDTDVIVTDSVGDVETAYISVFWDEEGESRVWYTGDCYRIEVKAWMPLPEPWKGES